MILTNKGNFIKWEEMRKADKLKTEFEEAKELLREAVSSLYFNYHYASKAEIRLCYCDKCLKDAHCAKDMDKCNFVWWKRDEYLKLFKEG